MTTKAPAPLEMETEEDRQAVAAALTHLWFSMRMTVPSSVPYGEAWEARMRAYRHIGEMLLGDDCPFREVWT